MNTDVIVIEITCARVMMTHLLKKSIFSPSGRLPISKTYFHFFSKFMHTPRLSLQYKRLASGGKRCRSCPYSSLLSMLLFFTLPHHFPYSLDMPCLREHVERGKILQFIILGQYLYILSHPPRIAGHIDQLFRQRVFDVFKNLPLYTVPRRVKHKNRPLTRQVNAKLGTFFSVCLEEFHVFTIVCLYVPGAGRRIQAVIVHYENFLCRVHKRYAERAHPAIQVYKSVIFRANLILDIINYVHEHSRVALKKSLCMVIEDFLSEPFRYVRAAFYNFHGRRGALVGIVLDQTYQHVLNL